MIESKAISGTPSQCADTASPASEPGARLHVAITSPFVWPWVRRGSERLLNDLSRYLIDRGHQVTIFATGPENEIEPRGGISYHLLRQRFASGPRQFNSCHHFAFGLQDALGRCNPDVVFSMNYFDAYAAIRARRRTGARYKVIFYSPGILSRRYFRAVPLDAWFFRAVRREADLISVVSGFARDVFRRDFGCDALVLPPPVVVDQFRPADTGPALESSTGPRILFVGDVHERRKGARALCRAFALVKNRYPEAELLFSGRASELTQQALLAEMTGAHRVRFLGVGRVEDLPAAYQNASVTVLPAVAEAFGMVLAESLAAGTPVVGAMRGGMTDIVNEELIGRLFDPGAFVDETDNVRALAWAILDVLHRGKSPQVVAACQASAKRFSWAVLGPEYERMLQRLVATRCDG